MNIVLAIISGGVGAAIASGIMGIALYKIKRADEKSDQKDDIRAALRYIMLYVILIVKLKMKKTSLKLFMVVN